MYTLFLFQWTDVHGEETKASFQLHRLFLSVFRPQDSNVIPLSYDDNCSRALEGFATPPLRKRNVALFEGFFRKIKACGPCMHLLMY